MLVFSCRPFFNILKYIDHRWDFPKQDSLKWLLKSSPSVYETSGSHFFRTTTGIQSGSDAFYESSFVMSFLAISGFTEILCSFRLVLERKTVKEITDSSRLEFLETFLTNNFALSEAEDKTSGLLIEEV